MKTVTLHFSQGKETKRLQIGLLRHAQIEGNRESQRNQWEFLPVRFWAAWSGELELRTKNSIRRHSVSPVSWQAGALQAPMPAGLGHQSPSPRVRRPGIHIDHQFFRICCGEIYGAMRPNSAIDSGFGVQPARLHSTLQIRKRRRRYLSTRTAANV